MPAREHGLQFVDRAVKLLNQGAKFIVIDHSHLTVDYTESAFTPLQRFRITLSGSLLEQHLTRPLPRYPAAV
jgi:hypothetical protein